MHRLSRGLVAVLTFAALWLSVTVASAAPLVGVFPDNDGAKITRFQNFIAPKKAEIVGVVVAMDSWPSAVRVDWIRNNLNAANWHGPVAWTVPLLLQPAQGTTLEQAAAGNFDAYYRQLAQRILADSPADGGLIYIRPGSEFNAQGWGYSWNSIGKEQTYIAAFRRLVGVYKSVSPRFAAIWCFAIGNYEPGKSYPGDDVVSVIDADVYLRGQYIYTGYTPEMMFDAYRTQQWGLEYQASFAAAHNKPMGWAEWGVGGDQATYLKTQNASAGYFAKAAAFVASHNFAYTFYWDRDADPGALSSVSNGASAAAGTAYKAFLTTTAANDNPTPPANDNVPKTLNLNITGGGFTWTGTATRP